EEYRGKVGLVIMRHLLEHMLEPAVFLRSVSKVLAQGAAVYIELPNLSDMLAKKRPYDFFYEHVNYFSPELLARFMESEGFEKVKVTMLKDGQHFGLLCRKVSDTPAPPGRPITLAVPGREESIQGFQDHVKSFKKALSDVCAKHSHIAVYGAGNHSIAVAAMMGWTSDDIECFLDINKMKSGFYTGVSHILITLPTPELVQKFDAIIIIASLHEVEIHKNLRLQFCFKGDIYSTYKEVRPLD
ncbi:class I SAM-dependent methyltransferase, partial [Candidatus Woesearchaeota archaeon]|nr:class I SAM-dependent methyltransferase [Candidatus Woesearchaeota archaeon]